MKRTSQKERFRQGSFNKHLANRQYRIQSESALLKKQSYLLNSSGGTNNFYEFICSPTSRAEEEQFRKRIKKKVNQMKGNPDTYFDISELLEDLAEDVDL